VRRVAIVMRKEFLELRQNLRLLPVIVVAPIIQLFFLGYAATTDVTDVPVVVADADRTAAGRELRARFEASPYFRVVDVVATVTEIDVYLESGRAWMALTIPTGYGRAVERGEPATVQVIADGTDSNSTTVALGYARNLVLEYAREVARAPGSGQALTGGLDARVRVWFNPELESKDFMVPGVLALLLLVVTANLSSMAIVRERETGTLEQLNVTPIRRSELILGKLLPYGIVGLLDAALVLAVTIFWFEVPLRGSGTLLVGLTLVYLVCTLGIGLFVSTISRTQQQSMMTTTFFFMMPMVYLSGFVFPIENMPTVIQPVTALIPLRYYLVIVRGIFLKGVGLETLWPEALALLAWGAAIVGLSILRLRKTAG
jgi:ABC-2 type transport system permease protein